MKLSAFTLVETMLAVLLLAILSAGVAVSFSKPLQAARAEDAASILKSFDATARQVAINFDKPVRIVLDLADGTLTRLENGSAAATARLPSGYRIARTKIDGDISDIGLMPIDISPQGRSRTYAVRVVGPGLDRWFVFAGLTGLASEATHEADLPITPRAARHDAD